MTASHFVFVENNLHHFACFHPPSSVVPHLPHLQLHWAAKRKILAFYHPHNPSMVHLDIESSQ
ncbi:putative xylosyltransferase [Sesbania bispinosa]|nr:putative xylosyltransferase [Sesbania bispinosa]